MRHFLKKVLMFRIGQKAAKGFAPEHATNTPNTSSETSRAPAGKHSATTISCSLAWRIRPFIWWSR